MFYIHVFVLRLWPSEIQQKNIKIAKKTFGDLFSHVKILYCVLNKRTHVYNVYFGVRHGLIPSFEIVHKHYLQMTFLINANMSISKYILQHGW